MCESRRLTTMSMVCSASMRVVQPGGEDLKARNAPMLVRHDVVRAAARAE
jgi:hypothetical protein